MTKFGENVLIKNWTNLAKMFWKKIENLAKSLDIKFQKHYQPPLWKFWSIWQPKLSNNWRIWQRFRRFAQSRECCPHFGRWRLPMLWRLQQPLDAHQPKTPTMLPTWENRYFKIPQPILLSENIFWRKFREKNLM